MLLPDHVDRSLVLALMVERARNALLLIGKGRRSLYANEAFLDMSGYSYDEWMSFDGSWVLTPDVDQVATGNSLNTALRGETTGFRLRPVRRKDETVIWTEACVMPLPIASEGLLFAEFRPPTVELPEGAVPWVPTGPDALRSGEAA